MNETEVKNETTESEAKAAGTPPAALTMEQLRSMMPLAERPLLSDANRAKRRAKGKRQRQARKLQRQLRKNR